MLNLRHQKKLRRALFAVGVKILAEGIGPAEAHPPVFRGGFPCRAPVVQAGINRKVDGPVELGAAFDHGKDQPLRAGLQGGFDLCFAGFAQPGKGRGAAAFNGPENIRKPGTAEGAVLHIHCHPIVPRPGHELGHGGRRQLKPGAHGGLVRRQERANFVYSHKQAACRRRVEG